jgi:hypothetical protein
MSRVEVAVQSVRPTLHATPLHPLVVTTSGLLLVAVAMRWSGVQGSAMLGVAGAGALAGAVALGLADEADAMLLSSPTGALRRLGHRLVILVPASAIAATALAVGDRLLVPGPSAMPSAVAVVALTAAGLVVQIGWSRRWPATAAEGAAVFVLTWALAGLLVPEVPFVHRATVAWHQHAPWVLGVSVVLVITGSIGRRI